MFRSGTSGPLELMCSSSEMLGALSLIKSLKSSSVSALLAARAKRAAESSSLTDSSGVCVELTSWMRFQAPRAASGAVISPSESS